MKRICVFLIVLAVAVGGSAWKWGDGHSNAHRSAGWTWDDAAMGWTWDGVDDGTVNPVGWTWDGTEPGADGGTAPAADPA